MPASHQYSQALTKFGKLYADSGNQLKEINLDKYR